MQVTRIEELDKTRSKVYLDGEFAFVLYKGELRQHQIREESELPQDIYELIMEEVLPKRARMRAMHLLQKKEYTVAQLRDKLNQGWYPPHIVETALQYVESFHYTDDLRYAVQYIAIHEGDRSRRRIEQDLAGKGIARETICDAWRTWEEQGGAQDEVQMMRKLLEKRHFDPEKADFAERRKQAAFLMRKGFRVEDIQRILSFT